MTGATAVHDESGTSTEADRPASMVRMPHIRALDGVRAIAVMAVLAYHAELAWIPGGFLGVEVFFVVSGYLITALLIGEHRRTGHVDLRAFWVRRARRLLPALGVFLAGSLGLALLVARDALGDWFGGSWAAALYVSNWYAIAEDISYTESFGRPSFLHHLWSLAIEEQFYVVWPLVMAFVFGRLGRARTLALVVVGIAASTALMWTLYEPLEDPLRVYYGTDTRAAGVLMGAALALVWRPWEHPVRSRAVGRRRAVVGALAATAGVIAVVRAFLHYDLSPLEADDLFRGGFLLTSSSTALLIAGLTLSDRSGVARLLTLRPLQWLGTRSYGIYLFHWPIFMVTRPRIDVELDGLPLLALRLALTFAAAEVSYRLVEQPLRRTRPRPVFGRRRITPATLLPAMAGAAAVVAIAATLVGVQRVETNVVAASPDGVVEPVATAAPTTTPVAAASDDSSSPPSPAPSTTEPTVADADADGVASVTPVPTTEAPADPVDGGGENKTGDGPAGAFDDADDGAADSDSGEAPAGDDGEAEPGADPGGALVDGQDPGTTADVDEQQTARRIRVTLIGDSVMEGSAPALDALPGRVRIDALVGRQWWDATDVIRSIADGPGLGDVVVVHLGNNGPVNDDIIDQVMRALRGVPHVLFVNVRAPIRWESDVNAALERSTQRWRRLRIVDWRSVSNDEPEFFTSDGVHLEAPGQRAYARTIARAIDALPI